MVISFSDKFTEKTWNGEWVKKLPHNIQEVGRRKLRMLNNSHSLNDLLIPPSNRLEKLKGDKKNFYSIRINHKWRIVFIWNEGNIEQVSIEDYH